jgi:plasmid stabilization system protein ParE
MARFWITPTARKHIRKILDDTRDQWGSRQATKYRRDLMGGLQRIADNPQRFRSPHREELVEGTEFAVHLVKHHYVAFQTHYTDGVIIAGMFHESMDIPTKLRELQQMARHEIDALRREIGFSPSKNA